MKEESSCRRARVDAVRHAQEVDVLVLELTDEVHKLLDGATEPIELPDDERVARSQLFERLPKPRTISALAAGLVLEELLAPRTFERVALNVETLILR